MPPPPQTPSAPSQRQKVDFLSAPASYPDGTRSVSVIQTHHAWVFLTDDLAYKMKRPFRKGRFDFSSLESRRRLCEEEYRLNRRLASRTYLGVVPLVVGADGRLALDREGEVVEWLVKMRRLPEERMLHVAAKRGTATKSDIHRLMRKLIRFYNDAPPCRKAAAGYGARLEEERDKWHEELTNPLFEFPQALVQEVVARQAEYLRIHEEFLNGRADAGFVREIHGDLRPEHVCLMANAEPEIIDQLEFDPDLRCLDVVEELAFFGLECRVIGQSWIESECIEWYRDNGEDHAPMHLWRFYAARRATLRAMLAAWHTLDQNDAGQWLSRGRDYLELALDYLDRSGIA